MLTAIQQFTIVQDAKYLIQHLLNQFQHVIDEIQLNQDEDGNTSDDEIVDLITNGVFPEGQSTNKTSPDRPSTKTLTPYGAISLETTKKNFQTIETIPKRFDFSQTGKVDKILEQTS